MTSILARYLTDFGGGGAARNPTPAPVQAPLVEAAPAIDLDAVRHAACEEGRQAAEAELAARREAALSELAAHHEAEIAKLRNRYEAELAEAIARRFEAMRAELGREIGRQAAEALAPLVERKVGESMAERFADAIAAALGDAGTAKVTIRGPAYLFGYLERLPALSAIGLAHVETDDVDLSTEIDGTILATRIAALAESLAEGGR